MKNYLKNLLVVSLSLIAIMFFVQWEVNFESWGHGGRVAFVFFSFFISGMASLIQSEK